MMRNIKDILKLFVPPIFGKIAKKIIEKKGFEFEEMEMQLAWKDIVNKNKGYEADNILEKCKAALLKVKTGEYPYERDSVLFDKIQREPLKTGL